jgi:hypothetical protein
MTTSDFLLDNSVTGLYFLDMPAKEEQIQRRVRALADLLEEPETPANVSVLAMSDPEPLAQKLIDTAPVKVDNEP